MINTVLNGKYVYYFKTNCTSTHDVFRLYRLDLEKPDENDELILSREGFLIDRDRPSDSSLIRRPLTVIFPNCIKQKYWITPSDFKSDQEFLKDLLCAVVYIDMEQVKKNNKQLKERKRSLAMSEFDKSESDIREPYSLLLQLRNISSFTKKIIY